MNLISNMEKWFNQNLLNNDKNFNILYQDCTPCDELIANVYEISEENYKYLVDSGDELYFKVENILEVYDCINDISKKYKKYGKCWHLYNKFRKYLDRNKNTGYEKYSIYISNYNDKNGEWIVNLL